MIREALKRYLPASLKKLLRHLIRRKPTRAKKESNIWLRQHASEITGRVLCLGSSRDDDDEGKHYRDYFPGSSQYLTLDIDSQWGSDLVLDVRSMPEIQDESFDCVFCSAVLEHVDDFSAALGEIARILKHAGILLLGLPFRQAIHLAPHDYWRFTEYGIRYMLQRDYDVLFLDPMDESEKGFPSAYWVKARKR